MKLSRYALSGSLYGLYLNMGKKITYQIPTVHLISSSKTAMGYCADGTGAAQVTSAKFCFAGFGPQPGADICESGSGNVTTYSECTDGSGNVVHAACEEGGGAF